MENLDQLIIQQIELALMEDIGPGDLTTIACIEPAQCKAEIIAKSDGVLAGLPLVDAAFKKISSKTNLEYKKKDADSFSRGDLIVIISGENRAILTAERTALNFLGRLSGIATLTSLFANEVKSTKTVILDTRKTTPGLRFLEKYAVNCGGGENHRYGLYDMALIKDNHISSAGSITKAVAKMNKYLESEDYISLFQISPKDILIEVEISSVDELKEAIDVGVTRIMLDNQSVEEMKAMVELTRKISSDIKLEASGNVSLSNIKRIAETGVDYISIGSLTHSAPSSDFSLKFL